MVYIKFPNFKTGIRPSAKTTLNMDKLSPTDKLMLARNRIWGNMIGGSYKNGYARLKKPLTGSYRYNMLFKSQGHLMFPGLKDWEEKQLRLEKFELRKERVATREMKVGGKKGSTDGSSMAVFELKNPMKKIGIHIADDKKQPNAPPQGEKPAEAAKE